MAKASIIIKMGNSILETGRIIRNREMGYISMKVIKDIKGNLGII
jgi:hypothetical protein